MSRCLFCSDIVLVTKMRAQKIGNLDGMIHDIPFSYLSPDKHCVVVTSPKTFGREGLKRVLLCLMYWKPYCSSCCCSSCFPYCFRCRNLRVHDPHNNAPSKESDTCSACKELVDTLQKFTHISRFVSKPPLHILRFPFRFLLGVNTSTFQWLQPSSLAMLWLHWKSRLQSTRRPGNQKDKSWFASDGTLVTSHVSMFAWKETVEWFWVWLREPPFLCIARHT